jgi:protocatechuate 3,4-dioxygenase beta subunit
MSFTRRTVLKTFALTPFAAACGDDGGSSNPDGGNGSADASTDQCARIPAETAGPFPGNGTNGANALALAGIVRSDIRTSVGPASGTAPGVELKLVMTLTDSATCMPLAGRAIHVWQADRNADYSMYTGAAQAENYLRGLQETDANGTVTFTTIFPACYPGRWPHIHFEVYSSVAAAMGGTGRLVISQLAFPKPACDAVYAMTGYSSSVGALANVSLSTDGVFRDGSDKQLVTMSGTPGNADFTATLNFAIA